MFLSTSAHVYDFSLFIFLLKGRNVKPNFTKAFVIGLVLCLFLGIADTYTILVLEESGRAAEVSRSMTSDVSASAAVFLLFILTLINATLSKANSNFSLSQSELIIIYVMVLVSCALPNQGVTFFIPILTSAFYYATPENEWADLIHPYIKGWMVPQDANVVKFLYEGAPKGSENLWVPWIEPLLLWAPFFIALYIVMISIMVIVRKQWIENERLVYPLMQLPQELVVREDRFPPILKSKLMWIGFIIPCIFLSINALHAYFPYLPKVQLEQVVYVFRRMKELFLHVRFSVIGFTYFVNLDIAFSLWFFNILFKVIDGTFSMVGISVIERLGPFSPGRSPIFIHQGMGAMIVLVIFGLWTGRSHIRSVFRKAFKGDRNIDDSSEILSYRSAVFSTMGGIAVMFTWLLFSGVPLWAVFPFLFAGFVLLIGLSRIVAESGISQVAGPITPQAFVSSGFGMRTLGPQGLTSIGFAFTWIGEIKTSVMFFCANGLKMAERLEKPRRYLFWAMLTGIAICFIGSAWATIHYGYSFGGLNLARSPFNIGAQAPFFEYAEPYIRANEGPRWDGWLYTLIGAGAMYLLMLARHNFLWWPLHPIGFPISSIWPTHFLWLSIFISWLFKSAILKYGGPKLFRQLRPLFLGLILGEFATQGIWLVINTIIEFLE